MTGWATITVKQDTEKLNEMAEEDYADLDTMKKQLKQEAEKRDWYATITTNNGHDLIQIGGYKDWDELEDFLKNIKAWEKAVILKANDTNDTGHAKYYEPANGSWLGYDEGELACIDEFEEQELAHGRPVGAKAAAYMILHHDVYTHNSLSRPRVFVDKVPEKNSEAYRKITKAYVQYHMNHVDDEKVAKRLRNAADMITQEQEDENGDFNRIEANYCPECGEPVKKAYSLTFEENPDKMRDVAATLENGCVKFSGGTKLEEGETSDFSELHTQIVPETAEVYEHTGENK